MPHDDVSETLRGHAKQLRRTMTRAETLLWHQLKAHRLAGLSFRRQTPIGNYIADFVSHSARLVVEVDGESHDSAAGIARDARRDAWFVARDYRVLRFTNGDVKRNLEGVVLSILEAASLTLPLDEGGNTSANGAKPCP
jgi:very-short-patch-repair endonuclease